ncbi:uncharacterized protein METZ01_LOCUS189585 [marine metagenome]|uniref:Uncharacterized protein n=1 Tax=marine metagenome TaxID=408172 RepID=A0A382DGC0_9ZZZZ
MKPLGESEFRLHLPFGFIALGIMTNILYSTGNLVKLGVCIFTISTLLTLAVLVLGFCSFNIAPKSDQNLL